MPTKNEIVKTSPRISSKSADWYKGNFSSVNAGLEYTLESMPSLYRYTLDSLKGRFSRGELMLMIDVNNGLILTPRMAGQHLGAQVSDGIALDRLDDKWKIDGKELNKKVSGLTIFEAACLELWIGAFWENHEHTDIEKYVADLTRKGKEEGR